MGCMQTKGAAPPAGGGGAGKGGKQQDSGSKLVMGRYQMHMDKASMMGQGSFSVCRKGTDTKNNNKTVAVKVYKSSKQNAVTLLKFQRQIEVLQELLTPFKKPSDPRYWNDRLDNTEPKNLFMELLDYSKSADGKPGPDPKDGVMYVITEIAQYSLKDYLALRRQQHSQSGQGLSKPSVRNICDAILQVMAGLHAKNLVHIDMKPENMMMFDGKLKLIDVDGCVKVGTNISITDSSISFSPCYCAPEWAKFLIDESGSTILASPALDVWSVGMTICELVTLDAVLKPMYASFLQNSNRSHQEAGFLFMEWLSSVKKSPTPKSIDKFDKELQDLVVNWLCDPNKNTRKTCCECLNHPYLGKPPSGADSTDLRTAEAFKMEDGKAVDRNIRNRLEDEEDATIHKSTLFKLNTGKKPDDAAAWLQRDIWITPNGNLCYWSQKDNKKLILIPSSRLHGANINLIKTGSAKEFAFEVQTTEEDEEGDGKKQSAFFSAATKEDMDTWIGLLQRAAEMDLVKTFRLGAKMAEDLQKFRVAVKNRRMKVENDGGFDAVFKGKLWKLKGEGDAKVAEHWFLRDFQIAKNGSLTYWSAREEKQLVYYTSEDVSSASVAELKESGLAKQFTFTVALPACKGVEFEPGCFAAESADMLSSWFENLDKAGVKIAK